MSRERDRRRLRNMQFWTWPSDRGILLSLNAQEAEAPWTRRSPRQTRLDITGPAIRACRSRPIGSRASASTRPLSGDDTPGRVRRLCAKARHPLGEELLAALDLADLDLTVAAICVYPTMVAPAVKALEGSGIPVASVATGFPAGLTPLKQRLDEIRYAVGEGAREIDIVITRAHVLGRDWSALYDEVAAMREV